MLQELGLVLQWLLPESQQSLLSAFVQKLELGLVLQWLLPGQLVGLSWVQLWWVK